MATNDSYNRFARAYFDKRSAPERSLWNDALDAPMVRALLPEKLAGLSVVDLGCGPGLFAARLAGEGARVTGVDLSSELIEIARRENPALEFAVGDVSRTGLAAARFDWAVSCLVMHYLSDLQPFFTEAARLLRRGPASGRFVFSFHHPVNEVLVGREGDGGDTSKSAGLGPYFHNDTYRWTMLEGMEFESVHHTFEDVVGALARSGFVIEELREARPDKALESAHPEWYRFTSRYPTFAAIRAALR